MGSVAEALEAVHAALDDAAVAVHPALSGEELSELACELQRLRARVDSLACIAAVLADQAQVHKTDKLRRVADHVALHCNTDAAAVQADLNLARFLLDFPGIASAYGSGRIHRQHVQALRRVHTTRTHHDLQRCEDELVTAATNCSYRDFLRVLQFWLISADPDGAGPREQLASRRCSMGKHADGAVEGGFRLDAVGGHAIMAAVDQMEQVLLAAEATGDEPARTAAQRRADALVRLLTTGAEHTPGITKPLVHVVIGAAVVEDWMARCAGSPDVDPWWLPLDAEDPNRRCELADGTPIHPAQAMAAMAIGSFRRLVLGPKSEILDLSRRVRCFPRKLAEAMTAACRGRCATPGCQSPSHWLQADHIIPWTRHGGHTATRNGTMRCDPCNKAKGNQLD